MLKVKRHTFLSACHQIYQGSLPQVKIDRWRKKKCLRQATHPCTLFAFDSIEQFITTQDLM